MTRLIRVLQVIGRADRGGAETWLVHVLRNIDPNQVKMDFLVHSRIAGAYDAEIRKCGARIIVCEGHRNVLRQWRGLREAQHQYGPYDIVHSHVDYYGGVIALLAWLVGIRTRITNSHNNSESVDREATLSRRLYLQIMRVLIRVFSTAGLGTGPAAAIVLFGERWRCDSRWRVIPACVCLSGFRQGHDRRQVRAAMGIEQDAIVVGHVGRFVEQKNHSFLIQLAERLAVRDGRVRFLLVGGGPLRDPIEAAVRERGLGDHFIILSPRDDVPRLMLGAMDYFLFPSHYEGLGLALVEAQAAGLRCLASTAIPPEAIAVPSLVRQKALADGPEAWADAILQHLNEPPPLSQPEALRMVEKRFDIRGNAAQLAELYMSLGANRHEAPAL